MGEYTILMDKTKHNSDTSKCGQVCPHSRHWSILFHVVNSGLSVVLFFLEKFEKKKLLATANTFLKSENIPQKMH